jgi:hypothetical protein
MVSLEGGYLANYTERIAVGGVQDYIRTLGTVLQPLVSSGAYFARVEHTKRVGLTIQDVLTSFAACLNVNYCYNRPKNDITVCNFAFGPKQESGCRFQKAEGGMNALVFLYHFDSRVKRNSAFCNAR